MTCCRFPCPRCMGWCWALVLKVFLVLTPVLTELWWEVLNYAHNRVKGLLFSARSFKKTPLCWAVPAAVRSQGGHVQQLDSEIVSWIPPVQVFWEAFCIAWVLFKEFLKQNYREVSQENKLQENEEEVAAAWGGERLWGQNQLFQSSISSPTLGKCYNLVHKSIWDVSARGKLGKGMNFLNDVPKTRY